MSFYFNAVCDTEGCRNLQSVGFDSITETFGDVVSALRSIGWTIPHPEKGWSVEGGQVKCVCPECSTKSERGITSDC